MTRRSSHTAKSLPAKDFPSLPRRQQAEGLASYALRLAQTASHPSVARLPSRRALARAWGQSPIQLNRLLALGTALQETAADHQADASRRVWRSTLVARLDIGLQWTHLAQLRMAALTPWEVLAACEAILPPRAGVRSHDWQARTFRFTLTPEAAIRDPAGTARAIEAHVAQLRAAAGRLGVTVTAPAPGAASAPTASHPLARTTPFRAYTPLVAGVDYDPDEDA